ncbi:riboflavin synthase [Companilactobacillus keshanensis]|uniref:Riboflavin synthase n=1 Tax=Companilactobacillus keshanensis TaxID=2486003 RepID=A0ABW4BU99_9LACO|nr:riboflavin synthase [Companilactobacillus keshanensis]
MFTGIIKEVGKIVRIDDLKETKKLTVGYQKLSGIGLGDSISVNGVCLTVTSFNKKSFTVDIMPESFRRTNLSDLKIDSSVNLEQSLLVHDRLDGHFVLGHVDAIAKLLRRTKDQNSIILKFEFPEKYQKYIVEKGSIAVNGISLTVILVDKNTFKVGIIPHTLSETNLKNLDENDLVNIEVDVLGRYIINSKLGAY